MIHTASLSQNPDKNTSFSNKLYLSLSFILPAVCMIVICILMGFSPFGKNVILHSDAYQQLAEFTAYYHRIIFGDNPVKDGFFYSFTKEMGGNMFGLFAYYLSSPFSLIPALLPRSLIPETIAVEFILKIGCAGLTCALFLKYIFKRADPLMLIFSSAYALSSYALLYSSICIMWLDGVIWLPVIILGVEYILDNRSAALFIFAYSVSLISNYYTAYANTLFVVLWFFGSVCSGSHCGDKKYILSKLFKMLVCGISGVMIASVILLPTLADISNGRLAFEYSHKETFFNENIQYILRRLFPAQYDGIQNDSLPHIFCGMICGIMTSVFFFNPGITVRQKLSAAVLYAVFILSFFIQKLDIAWHIFKYPIWLPYRYSFVFCFFTAVISYAGISKAERSDSIYILCGILAYILLLAATIAVSFVFNFNNRLFKDMKMVIFGAVVALVYVPLIILYIFKPSVKKILQAVLIFAACSELIVNGCFLYKGGYGKDVVPKEDYLQNISVVNEFSKAVFSDTELRRAENLSGHTFNDSMSAGYNGIRHFGSTFSGNIHNLTGKLGSTTTNAFNEYECSTLITDCLFGAKYMLSEKPINDTYIPVNSIGEKMLYENPYYLPMIFPAPQSSADDIFFGRNALVNQNRFAGSILGGNYVRSCEESTQRSTMAISFTADYDGAYYALSTGNVLIDDMTIDVNGETVDYKYADNVKKIFYLGTFKKGDNIFMFSNKQLLGDILKIYYIDTDAFFKDCLAAKERGIDLKKYTSTHLAGDITVEDGSLIYTTIPYETGWSAYVNGEKAEIIKAGGAFLAIKAPAGKISLELKFRPPLLLPSFCLSLLSLAAVIFALKKKYI